MSVCNYFGLSDWFDVSFSDSEKDILIFCPLFSEPLGDGVPCAEKKAHNWPRVLELSRLALSQGWAGKFSAWAAEAEKKL